MDKIAEAFLAGNPTRNLTESVLLNGLVHRFDSPTKIIGSCLVKHVTEEISASLLPCIS